MKAIASHDGVPWRGRWLRLRWSQSFAGQPVRLVARLVRAGETEEHILAAAALGRGAWTWRAPADLERIDILAPAEAADELRVDALGPVATATILAGLLRRRPGKLPDVLWPGTSERGRNVTTHEAFDLAPPDEFERFAREYRRPLEPEGLDAPLLADAARGPRLGFALAIENQAGVAPLSRTLAALAGQHDDGFRLLILAPAALAAALDQAGLDRRIEVTDLSAGSRGAQATLAAAATLDVDFVAVLRPGDEPTPEMVSSLRAFLARRPELDVLYADSAIRTERGSLAQLKPDWSPAFQEGLDYVGRPCLVRQRRLRDGDTWRHLPGRIAQEHGDAAIGHLKRVLLILVSNEAARSLPPPSLAESHPVPDPSLEGRAESKRSVEPGWGMPGLGVAPPRSAGADSPSPAGRDRGLGSQQEQAQARPHATLVVPTRDRVELLQRLCESLFAKTPSGWDLVIVDNGSEDAVALAYLTELEARADTTILRRPGPFNFSSLVNAGVEAARGEVVVLLNNDCEIVEADWLQRLSGWAMRPGIGAVGAKLLYADGTLQHAGVALGLGGEAGHRDRKMPRDYPGALGRLTVPHEVAAVTAACLAVRRETFLAVEGFDEALPVAFNDIDFCLRLMAQGYRNILEPGAVVMHAESASRGRDDGPRRARFLKEAALFRERWQGLILDDPYFHPMLTTFRFYDRLG